MNARTTPAADAFLARLDTYGHCDILIDRQSGFPLRDALEALAAATITAAPLADPLFASIPDEAPLLLRLGEEHLSLITAYLAHAAEEAAQPEGQVRSVAAFLFTGQPLSTIARRLTRHLELRIQTGQRVFFRYFDPRVMAHLPRILQPAQMAKLLDGIDYWAYAHWQGQMVETAAADFERAPETPAYVRLSVDSAQWAALQGIETFNLALRALRLDGAPLSTETELQLLNAVSLARASGLNTPEDIATLAACLLREGDGLLRQPQWLDMLQLARHDAIPLKDILEAQLPS